MAKFLKKGETPEKKLIISTFFIEKIYFLNCFFFWPKYFFTKNVYPI